MLPLANQKNKYRMQHKSIYFKLSTIAVCLILSLSVSAKEQPKKVSAENEKIKIIEDKTGIVPSSGSSVLTLYKEAVNWLKTPYRRGGTSEKGMDCSGLTGTIYANVFGVKLQRSSNDMAKEDVKDVKKEDLKPGDLVFFSTSRKSKRVNHVGIFLGNRHFVHSSCSRGVIISSLDEDYYRRTWVKGGKVTNVDKIENATPFFQKEYKALANLRLKTPLIEDVKTVETPSFETINLKENPNVFVK